MSEEEVCECGHNKLHHRNAGVSKKKEEKRRVCGVRYCECKKFANHKKNGKIDEDDVLAYIIATIGTLLTVGTIVIFITLRIAKRIDWSWWWILSPLIIFFTLILIILMVLFLLPTRNGGIENGK